MRRLQIVKEFGFSHLTNWGPMTKSMGSARTLANSDITTIANLSLEDRQRLEHIASRTQVYEPNGIWNCQDWVKDVLRQAVEAGVVTDTQCQAAFTSTSHSHEL
ncbi:hypothetical protein C8J57DRAFT_10660 [Mycena rebaudengoi]|nr:hypothetical protein C8J57DRAFT_10660 [Mycena rebaudengoi]